MNRIAMFFAGLLLMCSMSGCCLFHGHGYGGYGAGYPSYGGGGACGSCNGGCGVAPGGFPSAYAPTGQTAFAPGAYPSTALIDPLPTY